MIKKEEAKNLKTYFLFTYLIFWALIAVTGFVMSLDAPKIIQDIMVNICAWTPTFVILIMFKKLYPDFTFKKYMKLHFAKKVNPLNFLMSLLLQAGIVAVAVLTFFLINNKPLNTMTFISLANILPVFIIALTSGAMGEELGWRGYALNIFQKKYTPLVSAIILGTIWGLWHLPLMIMSGYAGLELLYYNIAFMVSGMSLSIIITFFYNKSKNVLIAMWLHFWFNFLLKMVIVDLLPLIIYVSFGYLITVILIVIFKRKEMLTKEIQAD
jgi:membrane protease YdiL (CAAX protease family)